MKILIPFLALLAPVSAETLRTANVTKAINEVRVYPGSKPSRLASVGEKVATPSSVQTGRRSRAELTFNDSSITRLGQNSVFSFRKGGRNVELEQGSILLQVPKDAGGATIRTATVTAAITGTTTMFEYSPGKWIKLITLEGTQKLYLNGSKTAVAVPAGQMIIMHPNARVIPKPVTIDIKKLVSTSPLAGDGTFGPLPPLARAEIDRTIEEQFDAKRRGDLLPTDYVISGPGNRTSGGIRDGSQDIPGEPRFPGSDFPDGQFPDGPFTDNPNP